MVRRFAFSLQAALYFERMVNARASNRAMEGEPRTTERGSKHLRCYGNGRALGFPLHGWKAGKRTEKTRNLQSISCMALHHGHLID